MKTYLQVSLRDSTTYDELREAAIRYDQSTIRWTNAMALGSAVASPADTAIPMDVDRIEKGGKGKKGKSKSAGKGKDKNKGKQKSKQGDKGYHSGKGYGNQQQTSWSSKGSSWQNSSWYNNSDGFGKGGKSQKGNKGKDSGKSKDVTCHKCGGQGHYARDCRVRAVGQSDNGASTTDGKADSTGKGNSTGSAQVNRVSFAPDVSAATVYREFNFDISGSDNFRDFSSFHVNMISKHTKPETKPTVFDEFVQPCEGDEQQFFSACADFSACGDFCSCRGVHEFAKHWTDGTSDVEQFSLQRLFQLDDMEHYSQSVWDRFQLGLYDEIFHPTW